MFFARILPLAALAMLAVSAPTAAAAPVTETVVHSFDAYSGDAFFPTNSIAVAGGLIFGASQAGGADDRGAVYECSPTGDETILASAGGDSAGGSGVSNGEGRLYGATFNDGKYKSGSIHRILPDGVEQLAYRQVTARFMR